jgi:hypothetical protein
MLPSEQSITHEMETYGLGRLQAIRRIQQRRELTSRRRAMIDVAREDGGSPVEMNNRLVGMVCFDLIQGGKL